MVTITIETDNDAFKGRQEIEIADILHKLATGIALGKVDESCDLYDTNGNKVGRCEVDTEPGEEE